METKKISLVEQKTKEENEVLKTLRREIKKSAKRGDVHFWWKVDLNLSETQIKNIVKQLEDDNFMVKNKNMGFKIIRW